MTLAIDGKESRSTGKMKMNRYHKSAVPKLPKKKGGRAMKRYDENFKIEALKLSDESGVKKACEQLNVNYGTLAGWRKRRVKKNREEKNADITFKTENSRLKKEIAELKNANEIQDQFGTFVAELVNEFSIAQIVRLRTSHFKVTCFRN